MAIRPHSNTAGVLPRAIASAVMAVVMQTKKNPSGPKKFARISEPETLKRFSDTADLP